MKPSYCIHILTGAALMAAALLVTLSPALASSGSTSTQMRTLKLNPRLIKIQRALPNLKLPEKSPQHKKAKPGGPDPSSAFDLVDMVDDESLISDIEEVAGWNPHLLFQDSAVPTLFYYIPRELRLVYDASGYHLRVQYNSIQGADQGSVLVTMELKAPYHSGDVKVLEKILKTNWDPASEVRALPAFGAEADLETLTAGFGFAPEQLHLTSPSTLRQACSLVVSMTPDQAEALIAQMSGSGVSGTLNVPVGENPVSIPVILSFDRFSGDILGGLKEWQSGQKVERLVNLAFFPVRLKSVNAFVMRGGTLKLERRPLKKSVKIAPKGAKPFRLPSVRKIFGSNVLMAWLDTELITQCKSCREHIDKMVRSGIGTSPMETVSIEAIPDVFDQYSIYKIIVEVKSRFFSASGDREDVRELVLTSDQSRDESLNLYVPPGNSGPLFMYRLRVISQDGRETVQNAWQPGTTKHIYLGSYQLSPLLGEPSSNEPSLNEEQEMQTEPAYNQDSSAYDE